MHLQMLRVVQWSSLRVELTLAGTNLSWTVSLGGLRHRICSPLLPWPRAVHKPS